MNTICPTAQKEFAKSIKNGRLTLPRTSGLLALFATTLLNYASYSQLAQFDFPATASLTVSAKDAHVSVINMALSTGTIETNIITGSYFPNEPYIEETGGWTSTTQAAAKNFNFTISAAAGYSFSITNISFNAYAAAAGPTAFGFAIGSSDLYAVNAPSASLLNVSQPVSGYAGLTSANIKIQGWLNGSRTSTGAGLFKLDDLVITGTVISTCTQPSIQASVASFPSVLNDQQTLQFTRGNGTGGILVVGKAGSASTMPESGTGYTGNLSFALGDLVGGGRAVYNGAGAGTIATTTQTVTGLSAETNYYYNFYEWNTVNTCYNIVPLAASAWTLSISPAAHPSSFTAAAASSSAINLAFAAASSISNADGYIILGRSDGVVPTTIGIANGVLSSAWVLPTGTSVIADVNSSSATSFSHMSLLSSTAYCYLIIPYNWNGANTETYNYYSAAVPQTTCASTLSPYIIGDYRTNPLFTGTYFFDSHLPDISGNYPWQKWTGTWTDITIASETPQALTTKPPTMYLKGNLIDIASGDSYNNMIVEGAATHVVSASTSIGLTIAAGKKLEIKEGEVTVSGKMLLNANTLLHVNATASAKISSTTANFIRDAISIIEIDDNGSLYIQSYLAQLWTGEERFHANSNIYIQQWDNSPTTFLISNTTDVTTYTDGGSTACFGNLIIDMGTSSNNQIFQLLPAGFSDNLTHQNLIFRTAATGTGFAIAFINSANYTSTIGGKLIIENTWTNNAVSLLNNLGTTALTVKGNVENNSSYAAVLKLCESAIASTSATLTVEGDLLATNSGIVDLNASTSGTGAVSAKVNLKGDLLIGSNATLLTTYANNNGTVNFTGTGDGTTAALTQTIDITSSNTLRNRQIDFIVNPLPSTSPFVQLAHDLELGTKAGITIKSAGIFDFNFAGPTANVIKIVSVSASTKFSSEQGSTLKISSPAGIIKTTATYGISTGNIQGISTTNRTYSTLATFWFTAKTNQTTGDVINSTGSTTSNGKIVIVDLADNSISLTPTVSFGVSNSTLISTSGGKLDIRRGQFIETTSAYIFPATGFMGGTLYMSPGTLYKIVKGNVTAAASNADLIPRMDGTAFPYNVQGTIEFAGSGAHAFQTIRGLRTYKAVKFSGLNTAGTDYKNLSNTVTIDSALIVTNSLVDCIDGVGNPIPFSGTGGLNMTDGLLRLKALNNANPELAGTYTGSTYSLTGGTIEFYGSTATQQQQIRGNYNNGLSSIAYNHVVINAAAANYNPVIANAGNVDLNSSFSIKGTMNVNSPAVLRMDKDESISGTGTFNVNAGAGLLYGGTEGTSGSAIEGLEASGTSVDAGNIRTSFRNLSTDANYGFVSPGNMPTGSGFPATVAGIYLHKTNSTDLVNLTNPVSIASGGVLSLNTGRLTTTAAKLLTLEATVGIAGGTNNNSFINGPLLRNTDGANAYFFPVGKSNSNRHFTFETTANYGDPFTGEYFVGTPPLGSLLGPSLLGIVNTEYWQLERGGSNTTNGVLTLNYVNPGIGNWGDGTGGPAVDPMAANTVQIAKRSSAAGTQPWYFTFGGSASAAESTPYLTNMAINSREISSFSYFTLGYSFNSILPIKLLAFTGNMLNDNAVLNWKVADMATLTTFVIEHSSDGLNFKPLTEIPSTNHLVYGYLHNHLFNGSHYYRLQINQPDGQHFFSNVVRLDMVKRPNTIINLSNTVVKTELTVNIISAGRQAGNAVIYDLSGRKISLQALNLQPALNQFHINTSQLPKGMYLVTVTLSGHTTNTLKFVKE